MIVKVPNCIFCSAPNTTKEHVFSRWTHKYMPRRKKDKTPSVRGVELLDGSSTKIVKMPGDIRDWQIACVCGGFEHTCNAGWMKALEDRTMPILTPLILGKNIYLTPIQQDVIASWVALKCMVAEYETGFIATTSEQRARMYSIQKSPESGWAIWIARGSNPNGIPAWSSAALKITEN